MQPREDWSRVPGDGGGPAGQLCSLHRFPVDLSVALRGGRMFLWLLVPLILSR